MTKVRTRTRRHPYVAIVSAALAVVAVIGGVWNSGLGRVQEAEASHVISGSPASQTVAGGQTGIVLTIVGTVPANVSSSHFNFTYDATMLVPTGGT